MNDSKISVRYAKALFALAVEQNLLDNIKKDILFIKQTWEQVRELRRFLESPIIKPSQKKTVVQELFFNKIEPITQSFLLLVLNNKRESFLAGITRVFIDFYKKEKELR
jgi:F-type H+-transporting ATPase subunit delta